MTRVFSIICIFIGSALLLNLSANASEIRSIEVTFYSEKMRVLFDPKMVFEYKIFPGKYNWITQKNNLREFYELLENKNYQILLANLENHRNQFELNDWFYYELLQKSVAVIFEGFPSQHQTLICWLLLNKSGFDARITFYQKSIFLNVYSNDEIFEVPLIEQDGKPFVNLSASQNSGKPHETIYAVDFTPNPSGRNFSFDLLKFPKLKTQTRVREVEFSDQFSNYKLCIQFDETIIRLMQDYPYFAENKYLEVPLSSTLSSSIIPMLKDIIEGKSNKEALETLVAFTRTAFLYKADEEVYGKSKPMISDELFHYKYSDCEDRTALFYNLGKELLGLPMIVVAFPDHVTVGVAAPESLGDAIVYNGRNYYICDPTGPEDSYEIGFLPDEYDDKPFEIITKYR